MKKITTGLAVAGLAALTLGTASPVAAEPGGVATTTTESSSPASPAAASAADSTPRIAFIEHTSGDQLTVAGLAPGASLAGIRVHGGASHGTSVWDDRFATLLDAADLGKTATLVSYAPGGRVEVDFVIEPQHAEGEGEPPATPVVHAVSQYDDDHLVIEGTVAHRPGLFSKTEVWAARSGMSWDFPSENGSFSLKVPASRAGEMIDVTAYYRGQASETTRVELVATERNTASEAHPLHLAAPAEGEVVEEPTPTFAGTGIPNSEIVVTRDGETSRRAEPLCETRVSVSGDWSCTSVALPAGSYETTVTETPAWKSAATQRAGAAFSVAADLLPGEMPVTPQLNSVELENTGELAVRVIAHNSGDLRMTVGDEEIDTVAGAHGRFTFHVDPELLGETAVITGLRGEIESPSLEAALTLLEAPAGSPLQAPRMHQVRERSDDAFTVYATTDYFPDEYALPGVIAKVGDDFVGASEASWNGATFMRIGAEHAGEEVKLFTVRGDGLLSPATTFTLAETEGNTASETFPLEVTSPAEGESIAPDTAAMVGQGIPGSTISIESSAAADDSPLTTSVLGDGSWSVPLTAPLTIGDHDMTVTETPYWRGVPAVVSARSFTVADSPEGGDGSEGGEADERAVTVTAPVDGSTFAAGSVVTFTGTATPDADIAVHLGYGLAPVTGEADAAGDWTVSRWLGNAPYTATVTQSKDGRQIGGAHTGPTITPATIAPIVVTAPAADSTFTAGSVVTFTGTATPDADIAVHLGYGLAPVTGEANAAGDWTVSRWLGNAPYTATITQSKDGKQIGGAHTGPTITPATTAPIVVTAPAADSTFTAGSVVTFTGTATPDADIAVHLGYGLAPVTGTANASGVWTVSRWLGNAPYTATVVQSKDGKQIGAAHTGPRITPAS